MKFTGVILILFAGYALSSVINNVRLIDHATYMVDVITMTMKEMERRGWCNFKLPDHVQKINEDILNRPVTGEVRYTNGFVVSIQYLDIIQSTVQQVWLHNTTSNITTVSVRGTLRMLDVGIGYDVVADLSDGKHRYTSVFVQPLISFAFSVIKNLHTEDIEVTVVATVTQTRNIVPVFRPQDKISDILATMYDSTAISSAGMVAWSSEILQPIAEDIVANQVKFPTFCYNCPVTA